MWSSIQAVSQARDRTTALELWGGNTIRCSTMLPQTINRRTKVWCNLMKSSSSSESPKSKLTNTYILFLLQTIWWSSVVWTCKFFSSLSSSEPHVDHTCSSPVQMGAEQAAGPALQTHLSVRDDIQNSPANAHTRSSCCIFSVSSCQV